MIKIINIAFYLIFLNSYICENNISLINKSESTQFVDLQKPNLRHGGLSNSYTIREKYNNLGRTDEKLQNIQGFYNTNDIQTIQGQDDSIQAAVDPIAPEHASKESSLDETSQAQLREKGGSGTGDHTSTREEKTKTESGQNESEDGKSAVGNPTPNLEHATAGEQPITSPSTEGLIPSVKNPEDSKAQNQLQTIPDHQEQQEPAPSGGLEQTKIVGGVTVDNKDGTGSQMDGQHADKQEHDAVDDEEDEDDDDDDEESAGEEQDEDIDTGNGVDGKPEEKGKKKKKKEKDKPSLSTEPQAAQDSVEQPQPIQSDSAVTESAQKHSSQEHAESASVVDTLTPRTVAGVTNEDENLPREDALQEKALTPEVKPKPEVSSQETKVIEEGTVGGSTSGHSTELPTDQSDLNAAKEVDKVQTSEQEKQTPIIQEIAVPEGSYDEGDEDVEEEEDEVDEEEEEDEDEDDEEELNEEEELDGELDYEEIEEGEVEVEDEGEGEGEDEDDDSGGENESSPSDERETRDRQMENGDMQKHEKQPTDDILSEEEISESAIEKQKKQEESSRKAEQDQSQEHSEQQKQKEIKPPSNDSSAHKSLIKDFKDDTKVKKEAENKVKNMINLIGDSGVVDTLKDLAKDMAQIFLNL
ncbi:MSP3-like protein [Plasmodium gallinaceum]|uniref:MSP3-like protein n=1 Tax=Plasmodium gallinaceum TaxID=5849 RepID=A0A1J1GYQ3_PLAGA|nr:MSP3-like protein [Plasmodium gallinaceum]CRG97369.1 MSP3-like protein [Plasmodium gallinaceum]